MFSFARQFLKRTTRPSLNVSSQERLQKLGIRVLTVVNIFCAGHLFMKHVGWVHWVEGPSMMPTMSVTGEMVIENRLVLTKNLRRGDLITYFSPLDPSRIVCKRLIGLPGDIICVDPTGKYAPSTEHVVIPKGHIWLSGDNAKMSRDSRTYGPVSLALVRGRLVARILPLRDATIFSNNFEFIDESKLYSIGPLPKVQSHVREWG